MLTAKKPGIDEYQGDLPDVEVIEIEVPIMNRLYSWLGIGNASVKDGVERSKKRSKLFGLINRFRIRRGLLVLGRMPDLADFWIAPALRGVRGRKWDVVVSTYAPYASHAIAYRLKCNGNVGMWVADFRDGWVCSHNFRGLFPWTVIERFIERKFVGLADSVSTVSTQLAEYFADLGANKPVLIVPNGFDHSPPQEVERHVKAPNAPITITHTGTLYPGNENIYKFLDGLRLYSHNVTLGDPRVVIQIAGSDLSDLKQRINEAGLSDYFEFLGVLPREQALSLQWNSDVLLFFDVDAEFGVPSGKLYEYIAANVPILRIGKSEQSAAWNLIDRTRTGLDAGNDPQAIAGAIEAFAKDRQSFRPYREIINKYQRHQIMSDLARDVAEAWTNRCDGKS